MIDPVTEPKLERLIGQAHEREDVSASIPNWGIRRQLGAAARIRRVNLKRSSHVDVGQLRRRASKHY